MKRFVLLLLFQVYLKFLVLCDSTPVKEWWENGIFYNVLVDSFRDDDGDGIGDIQGLTSRLGHVSAVGASAIILSPIISHSKDCSFPGILDFMTIDSRYGNEEQFNNLLNKAKKADIKVIVTLPLRTLSKLSEWYEMSEKKSVGYEDFIYWTDTPESTRSPEKNITWEKSKVRDQFVATTNNHEVLLNLNDSNLRSEIRKAIYCWLDRGISGFVLNGLNENLGFIKYITGAVNDYSHMHGPPTRIVAIDMENENYYFASHHYDAGAQIVLNHAFLMTERLVSAKDFKFAIDSWMTYSPENKPFNWMSGAPNYQRMASHFGAHLADAINALVLLLPGVAITNQGDELGMPNTIMEWADEKENVCGITSAMGGNSPFHWDDSVSAGFSVNQNTWLPIASNFRYSNLKSQKNSPRSHYRFYQALSQARQSQTIKSQQLEIKTLSDSVLAFIRYSSGHETFLTVINFGHLVEKVDMSLFIDLPEEMTVYVSSASSTANTGDKINIRSLTLMAGETVVLIGPPRSCGGPGPIDKLTTKLNEAMQKINKYLNVSWIS